MTAYTALMAALPPRHYSLRIDATHTICSASFVSHESGTAVIVCSATGSTVDQAMDALLARWQGREQVAA
jgi:hypothetical protein